MFAIIFLIIKIFVAFSALILIHELGHFIAAKKSGVWVEEFGLGLPPRIAGKKIGDTLYSINLLPLGGFVKLHGETSSDEVVYPEKAFTGKSKITKIFITLAGIFMNFFLAVICFGVIFFATGIPGKIDVTITGVAASSPAQMANIVTGDIIEKVNNKTLSDGTDFTSQISSLKGQEISLEIKRGKEALTTKLTPRVNPPAGEGSLGVRFSEVQESYFPPVWQRPFVSAWYGLKQTVDVAKGVVLGLGNAAQSVGQGKSPQGLTGPVGIISLFKRFAEIGTLALINLVGIVSINLAIINIIPFPPLDGSRVAIVIIEWLTKKKMTPKIEEKVYFVGFAILIGLMILITAHEVPAVFKAGGLDKYANTILNQK